MVADQVPPNFTVGRNRTMTQLAYDDLIPLALRILDHDHVASGILRQSYSFAFFDEFQDCTTQQFELIEKVFGDSDIRITAVGDSKQRIMGWAGALENAMDDYLDQFSAAELPIYQNHRSLKRLRRVQNAVIKVMAPAAALLDAELASQTAEEVTSDGEVDVLGFATATDEAKKICELIVRDITLGTPSSEIAILTVHEPDLIGEELVQLLTDRGVAVRHEQSAQDAFGEPVGELILDMTRLLILGHAPDEYVRISEFMTRFCVDEEQAHRRLRRFDQFLKDTRAETASGLFDLSEAKTLEGLIFEFLKICQRQYLSRLSVEYTDDLALTAAARAAITVINDAISQSDSPRTAVSSLSQDDAVRLLTVHKSKGLEFDHVYFLAVEAECFFKGADAGRSTYFVGISRARTKLVLTHVQQRVLVSATPYWWKPKRHRLHEFLEYAAVECSGNL